MKRFVQGDSRTQSFLLPEALDDYVTDTNPVRVVDVFVDELDLRQLGFEGVEPALTGRPSYHPNVTLKIYIYASFEARVGGLPGHLSLAGLIAAFCRNQPCLSLFTPRASSVRFAGLAPALGLRVGAARGSGRPVPTTHDRGCDDQWRLRAERHPSR
jgi:hypothetical protein